MPHLIEPAVSGRSRCRGCGKAITRGTPRFGERLPNPYSDDGDLTIWYHTRCAAYRRPESLLTALDAASELDDAGALRAAARFSQAHPRVCRIAGVERATSGRARCRSCRELIARETLRIPLLFHEEGMYTQSGFVHLRCAASYFGSNALLDCIQHFSPALSEGDLEEVQALLG